MNRCIAAAACACVLVAGCSDGSSEAGKRQLELEAHMDALERALARARGRNVEELIGGARDRVFPALVNVRPYSVDLSKGARRKTTATGSGVLIDAKGYVLTNYHVAGKAERLLCTLSSKAQVEARLVGGDPWTDLAVIQLSDDPEYHGLWKEIRPAELGDSDTVRVGDTVLAMGSPLELARSVSRGIVMNRERYLPPAVLRAGERTGEFNTWLQVDALINPGNSGGPLVNLSGRVIGVNARARYSFGGTWGIGFAIPINTARRVVRQLVRKGKVTRADFGLVLQSTAESRGRGSRVQGVTVSDVISGGPADLAGLRAGDLLTGVAWSGRREVFALSARYPEELPAVRRAFSEQPVGEPVTLSVERRILGPGGSSVRRLEVAVRSRLLAESVASEELAVEAWGMTFRAVTPDLARQLRLSSLGGVLVLGVRETGRGARAGLQSNMVIRKLAGLPVADLGAFTEMLKQLLRKERVLVQVETGGIVQFYVIKRSSKLWVP